MNKKTVLGRELRNSVGAAAAIPWNPALYRELANANGNIDPSTLGYQYTIQTTTQIRAEVIEQKFYEVPIAEFIPVIVGTGAWMESIKTNLVYDAAGAFETGLQDLASGPSQIANVDVGMAPVNAKILTWAKGYLYTLPEVEKALASNNWDVVASKMAALKRNWDLGLQKVAFLGFLQDLENVPGLLSNDVARGATVNTAVITKYISSMSPDEFQALVASIMGAFFANSNSTELPDTFVIPMQDFLGLATPVSSGFPVVSMLDYLETAFKRITGNANFKVRGVAYCDQANNAGYWATLGTNRYCLYKRDRETIKMDIPVDFNLYPAGTSNNFQWQGVGAAQFTGCIAYRVAQIMYFDWAA